MDVVKIHNLDRSPVFIASDCGTENGLPSKKVDAVAKFLRSAGVRSIETDAVPLHQSTLWKERPSGTPDIVLSAANELDVRYHIEAGFPPIQLYATTGKNWQTTLIRHLPNSAACSLCLFPLSGDVPPTICATDSRVSSGGATAVDAALPFLSFGAGLMTACEIMKLSFAGYPFSAERVTLYLGAYPTVVGTPISHRPGCSCEDRNIGIHRKMVEGSRYAALGLAAR